jgi:hypothetical protein
MELAGIAQGGNIRSTFSDFDIKNAAQLEAHINMNAIAARANFDKYYAEKLTDVSKLYRDVRRRLDVREALEVPVYVMDVGRSQFDYSKIGELFREKWAERQKNVADRAMASAAGDTSAALNVRKGFEDDPFKLVITGCDYTNVDKVVANLKMNNDVTHLSLANNGLESDDCAALATLIRENKTIISLDLSNNKLGGEGVAKLADALLHNSSIEDLDLSANGLAKSAGKALAPAIGKRECSIKRLQLAGNQLGIYGTEELCSGLRVNTSILSLGLQNNGLGNDGAMKLAEILPPKEESIDAIWMIVQQEGSPAFNTTISQVNVEGNRIDDNVALDVARRIWINDQIQMRRHLVELETRQRQIVGDVDEEWKILELFFKKSTEELLSKHKESAEPKATPPPAKGAKAHPSKGPVRGTSKSPERPSAGAKVPAPAGSRSIKAVVKPTGKK